MAFRVTTTVEIDPKRIQDLIVGAFEGGSNYWLGQQRVELIKPSYDDIPRTGVVWYGSDARNIFAEDDFCVSVETEEGLKHLNPHSVGKALQLMAEKYRDYFNDIVSENDDGTTSDIFFQLCLFEEVVYG